MNVRHQGFFYFHMTTCSLFITIPNIMKKPRSNFFHRLFVIFKNCLEATCKALQGGGSRSRSLLVEILKVWGRMRLKTCRLIGTWLKTSVIICDTLRNRNLVPFVQFKNVKNTHGEVLLSVCNFTKGSVPPWVFFTFLKLYKWYQIA